jgi:tRNA A37 threonylcarbamoyladenosine dehydratase
MSGEFSRTELLIGRSSLEILKKRKVAVFGIGGVGSYVVEGLVRCGLGSLVLIDNDFIAASNINRQLHATSKTVGRPKVEVMKERILEINPKTEVTVHQEFYLPQTAGWLVSKDYDYIVDAIDTVTGKIGLVVQAKSMGIPIISSMGAGNKLDPTGFEVADIFETSVCPLAKVMRKELRERGIKSLKVVYSKEEPIKMMQIPDSNENSNSNEEPEKSINQKRFVPGSISFVPSVVGLIIAGEVVKDLIGYENR